METKPDARIVSVDAVACAGFLKEILFFMSRGLPLDEAAKRVDYPEEKVSTPRNRR